MADRLTVDSHDAGSTIASEHREDVADALPCDVRIAAPEEAGSDRFLTIDEEERLGVFALEVLLDALGLIGVKKRETRLAGDRVPKERAELSIADQVDELVRIGEGMAVIGRQDDERVARRSRGDRTLQGFVEERGFGRVIRRLRP